MALQRELIYLYIHVKHYEKGINIIIDNQISLQIII